MCIRSKAMLILYFLNLNDPYYLMAPFNFFFFLPSNLEIFVMAWLGQVEMQHTWLFGCGSSQLLALGRTSPGGHMMVSEPMLMTLM